VYRRAYYAAISYTDYNIGRILDKLDALGLTESTITVVFGDHGYQLGEHATW
jgi:iduronate 2-sulfatase